MLQVTLWIVNWGTSFNWGLQFFQNLYLYMHKYLMRKVRDFDHFGQRKPGNYVEFIVFFYFKKFQTEMRRESVDTVALLAISPCFLCLWLKFPSFLLKKLKKTQQECNQWEQNIICSLRKMVCYLSECFRTIFETIIDYLPLLWF